MIKKEMKQEADDALRNTERYHVDFTLTEPMLGSSPADPGVYREFIASKSRSETAEATGDEEETLPADRRELTGWSVYHRDEKGIFIFDYKIRGFLKEAARSVLGKSEVPAFHSKIDRLIFVTPRRIHLYDASGKIIEKAAEVLERPVRAMTAQGPRITVKRSDQVPAGTTFSCDIQVLPLANKDFTGARIRRMLDYGAFLGLGEWRTGSYGRFSYELTAM